MADKARAVEKALGGAINVVFTGIRVEVLKVGSAKEAYSILCELLGGEMPERMAAAGICDVAWESREYHVDTQDGQSHDGHTWQLWNDGEVAMKVKVPKLPRAPLPRKTGGPHKVKKNTPWRRRKHKKSEIE